MTSGSVRTSPERQFGEKQIWKPQRIRERVLLCWGRPRDDHPFWPTADLIDDLWALIKAGQGWVGEMSEQKHSQSDRSWPIWWPQVKFQLHQGCPRWILRLTIFWFIIYPYSSIHTIPWLSSEPTYDLISRLVARRLRSGVWILYENCIVHGRRMDVSTAASWSAMAIRDRVIWNDYDRWLHLSEPMEAIREARMSTESLFAVSARPSAVREGKWEMRFRIPELEG